LAEFDRRSIWTMGYPVEATYLDLEIHRLVAIFAASATLAESNQFDWSWLKQHYEFPEACRILVSLAALLRNQIDTNPATAEEAVSGQRNSVGTLVADLRAVPNVKALTFREACNKILHADAINPDVVDSSAPRKSALNPVVYLYGSRGEISWKASLNVYEFAHCAHLIA
jgi:hypothetical protein